MTKTKPTAKLTDTQLVILSTAAQRDDYSLLPFPDSLSARGAALTKSMKTLQGRGLVEEREIDPGEPEWRRDEENRLYGLFVTEAGLSAIGLADEADPGGSEPPVRETKPNGRPSQRKASKKRPTASASPPVKAESKQDIVVKLLSRKAGASIDEMVAETGWQRHSVRGFLSAVVRKKLGLPLESSLKKDGVRRYRIAAQEA
ncbi:MAG: DUF3489 domain-containing protein [Methyloligella sp. ZOD6]